MTFSFHFDLVCVNRFCSYIVSQKIPFVSIVPFQIFLSKTLFFEGGEQLAMKFKLPVLYLSLVYISPGKYRGEVRLLHDGVEAVEKHEITERYVRELERDILAQPARWMWSHRRWKFQKDPVTGEMICNRKGI